MSDAGPIELFVIQQLEKLSQENGVSDFGPQMDVLAEGILDSVALLNVIMEIEQAFQASVDFSLIDPTDFENAEKVARTLARLAGEK